MTEIFFADMVREASVTTGPGPMVLAGALPGHRRFADAVPTGAQFGYAIAGVARADQWETGVAVLDAQGRLARSPQASSNAGQAVDFSAGLKTVALTVVSNWLSDIETRRAAGISGIDGLDAALAGKQPAGAYAAASHGHDLSAISQGSMNKVGGRIGVGTDAPSHRLTVRAGHEDSVVRVEALVGAAMVSSVDIFASRPGIEYEGGGLGCNIQGNPQYGKRAPNQSAQAMVFDSLANRMRFAFATAQQSALAYAIDIGPAAVAPTGNDGIATLGEPGARWSTVYAASGAISTSDARSKTRIGAIPGRWLDAWGDVQWARFRFRRRKRWHVGLVAQRVHDAFAARGIDAFAIGLLCRDACADGDRWGLRYDEAQAIEAAWQRRELARIDRRLSKIEARL